MIRIENFEVMGWEHVIRGMRNPMNSWDKSDSGICKGGVDGVGCKKCANQESCKHSYDRSWQLGKADHELMMKLAKAGSVHGKFRRMITVYMDIIAPLYWWKEFDTYKLCISWYRSQLLLYLRYDRTCIRYGSRSFRSGLISTLDRAIKRLEKEMTSDELRRVKGEDKNV